MFSIYWAFVLIILYFAFLFLIALWGDSHSKVSIKVKNSAITYSLSLAVYCTSWTYYGNIGQATGQGINHIALFLGSTLAYVFFAPLLKRMVRIKTYYHSTSIADFISTRYNNSYILAAIISLLCLIGIIPYISIQFKSIFSAFNLVTGHSQSSDEITERLEIIILVFIIIFTIVFGVRKLDPTERHPGMMIALAAEGIFKLVAFLIAAILICFVLFDGPFDIINRIESQADFNPLTSPFSSPPSASGWFAGIILGIVGILALPRQFHVGIVECDNEDMIDKAKWLFPCYLLVINFFVIPIAMAGTLSLPDNYIVDLVLLEFPINTGYINISALVFLGGFTASTGMIMISAMTLSTMATNHIVVPILEAFPIFKLFRRYLLIVRWIVVVVIIFLGLLFYRSVGEAAILVKIGSISFIAIAQLLPVLVGAILWEKGNLQGAISGVIGGAILWAFTSLFPALIASGWFDKDILVNGLFSLYWLRPENLFGVSLQSSTAHSFFWTLFVNCSLYVTVSQCFTNKTSQELAHTQEFMSIGGGEARIILKTKLDADIALKSKYRRLLFLFEKYLGKQAAREKLDSYFHSSGMSKDSKVNILQLAKLRSDVTGLLAGIIGMASANRSIQQLRLISESEQIKLQSSYSQLLAESQLPPDELLKKVDYFQEKQQLLEDHSKQQQTTISQLEKEQQQTNEAKRSLKELNDELETRVLTRTQELSQANGEISNTLTQLRNTQHQLVEADRMASLGSLVAGVAHEINTPVGIILTAISKLEDQHQTFEDNYLQQKASKKDMDKFLQQIKASNNLAIKNIKKTADLVSNFKQVAVDLSSEEKKEFLLNKLLHSSLQETQAKCNLENIRVDIDCDSKLALNSYPNVITRVLSCLLMNTSIHGYQPLELGRVLIEVVRTDFSLQINYSDWGVGLNAEGKAKMFEPFYTTTRGDGGSGLGGHIVYNLITQTLQGDLSIAKSSTEGFKLEILLPLTIVI